MSTAQDECLLASRSEERGSDMNDFSQDKLR